MQTEGSDSTVRTLYGTILVAAVSATLWGGDRLDGVQIAGAAPSAEALVARARKGPALLFTRDRLPEIRHRIAHDPDAAAWWREFRDNADKAYVRQPVDIPDRGAQWYHHYSCRKCGTHLVPKSRTLHVCPSCGETHTGWPYDDAALFATQKRAAAAALDCALVYALDGSPAFAATARAYLTGLAAAYPGYLPHNNRSSDPIDLSKRDRPRCGRAFPQALDESTWLIKLLQAYDCLGDALTADEQAAVKEKLFRPAADLIKRDSFGIHNHECWHLAAYGLAGLVLGDAQWVADAIDSPTGVKMQLEKGMRPDRCWFEGSWGYHFYTMNALAPFLAALSNLGYPPPMRFKDMFDAPFGQVTPTWHLPAVNDTVRMAFMPGDNGELYELAWFWWRDPAYGWWLSSRPRRTRAYALLGTPIPPGCEPPSFVSMNYADSGMAILRGRTPGVRGCMPDNYVAVDYGPHGGGHGHPDKLNLILWGRGEMIAEDPGCIDYGNPRHWEWYRATLAHNTLVMDGLNQKRSTGRCLSFVTGGGATTAVFEAGDDAYPGACVRRAVALAGDVVIDVMLAEAKDVHRWEWAFHARNAVTTSVALADCAIPPPVAKPRKDFGPESDGAMAWSWTTDAREGAFDGTWSATWRKPEGAAMLGVVQAVRDGVTGLPLSGVLRTAVASAQPPAETFSLAVPRVDGRKVMFASVLTPGRGAASARIEEAVWDADGTARLTATVDGRRHAFILKADGTSICK